MPVNLKFGENLEAFRGVGFAIVHADGRVLARKRGKLQFVKKSSRPMTFKRRSGAVRRFDEIMAGGKLFMIDPKDVFLVPLVAELKYGLAVPVPEVKR